MRCQGAALLFKQHSNPQLMKPLLCKNTPIGKAHSDLSPCAKHLSWL